MLPPLVPPLSSWGHTGQPECDTFGLCHVPMCITSLTSEITKSVVWHDFPILWLLAALGWSEARSPPHHPSLPVASPVSQAVVSLQGWGQIPSLCALGGSVLHAPHLTESPHSQQEWIWPGCAHHS